jgi:Glycosyl transferases group 1/Glycosyl transferase 4-like domain
VNITVLTTRLFSHPCSGGEICTARLIAELRRAGHQLQVLGRGPVPLPATNESIAAGPAAHYVSLGPLVQPFDSQPRQQQLRSVWAALKSGQASTVQRLGSGDCGQQVAQLLLSSAAKKTDVLLVDHLQTYAWVAALKDQLPRPLLVMHNLESEGYLRSAQAMHTRSLAALLRKAIYRREARLLQHLERAALQQAAAVAALSAHDADQLKRQARSWGSDLVVNVLPAFPLRSASSTAVPIAERAAQHAPTLRSKKRRVGMIGTWTWGPNRAGLQWMLGQVLPHLADHCELLIAGAGLRPADVPAGVQVLGRIADVGAFYASLDVLAIASFAGSGIQEKAIEAIGTGLPVVATAHAMRGLELNLPDTVYQSNDATHFAHLCATVGSPHATSDPQGGSPSVATWSERRLQAYRQALQACLAVAAAAPHPAHVASVVRAEPMKLSA